MAGEETELDRRTLLRRGAASAWVVPAVLAAPQIAAIASPPPGGTATTTPDTTRPSTTTTTGSTTTTTAPDRIVTVAGTFLVRGPLNRKGSGNARFTLRSVDLGSGPADLHFGVQIDPHIGELLLVSTQPEPMLRTSEGRFQGGTATGTVTPSAREFEIVVSLDSGRRGYADCTAVLTLRGRMDGPDRLDGTGTFEGTITCPS